MKILEALKKICFTTFTTFGLLVYSLYLFGSIISSQTNKVVDISYLNGFLLFGVLLGIAGVWKDSSKMQKLLKRVTHLIASLLAFLLSFWISGYFTDGANVVSPTDVPNRVLKSIILFLVVYFLCLGIAALFRKIVALSLGKKSSDYTSVFSKK